MLFSEPKIPQSYIARHCDNKVICGFSALQRAENSSIKFLNVHRTRVGGFQCSSASRKFLNPGHIITSSGRRRQFQCSSASRKFLNRFRPAAGNPDGCVSVLFSEPKIPQSRVWRTAAMCRRAVSVLFSEPKIPQSSTLAPASIHISDRDDHASSFLSLPGASP